jgi:mono/diheme cytochrome c family protein
VLLREKSEPSEGYAPLPLLLLGLLSALIFFSGIYMGRYSGGFDPLVYDENVHVPRGGHPGDAGAAAAPVDPIKVGQRLFTGTCATCHQPTGTGVPNVYPPLAGSEWVNGTEERVIRIVLNGLNGSVTVASCQFSAATMPAFGPTGTYNWRDDQIAAVLSYVRQAWGNHGAPVTPENVAAIRTIVSTRPNPWTQDELLKIAR